MNYYESIPIGKENAILREELCDLWGKSARSVRRIIEKLRKQDNGDDFVIVSTAHQAGYFRSDNRDDITAFKAEVTRRGKHTFRPLSKANRILGVHNNQSSITNQLKMARHEANITADDVVSELKKLDQRFDASLLSKIENGLCLPTIEQLEAISKMYNRSMDELIGIYIHVAEG